MEPSIKTYAGGFLAEGQEIIVPQGSFFVMGDNRSYSSDSREFGFVKKEELVGISLFVYWPISDLKLVKNPL